MAVRARAGFQIVVWFAAANFGVLVVAVLALLATGTVGVSRLGGAARVLGGSAEAVPTEELAALRDARETLKGRGDEAELMTAWAEFKDREDDFEKRKVAERRTLETLEAKVEKMRVGIKSAHDAFRADRAAELRKGEQEAEARRQRAFDKVKGVYRYMHPAEVARDLEARLESGQAVEVADILRVMNDRAAAEALEAIADPALRIRIYNALAGTGEAAQRP
ncbi:MAG: hypothetical protein ACYTKD_21835 [Planctomycetota bacterium]